MLWGEEYQTYRQELVHSINTQCLLCARNCFRLGVLWGKQMSIITHGVMLIVRCEYRRRWGGEREEGASAKGFLEEVTLERRLEG